MLDTLILHLPMKSEFVVKNGSLSSIVGDVADYQVKAVPLSFNRDLTGHVTVGDLRHPFESIPSSYGSMAMKFNAVNVANTAPYVSLNASVKFLQGHNIFGTCTVENLAKEMLAQLALHSPFLFVCLDIPSASISRIDSTYSAVLPSESLIQPTLKYLANVSNGHRKNDTRRDFYNTTYFGGKNSRNGGAKIYGKGHEVKEMISKLAVRAKTDSRAAAQLAIYTPQIVAYSEKLLRLESSTKRRVLEQLFGDKVDTLWKFIDYEKNNPDVLHLLWSYWFQPILDTLKGTIVRKVDDHEVLELLKESLWSYKGVKLTKKRKFIYHRPPRPSHLHLPLKEHDKYYGKRDYQVSKVPVKIYTKANNAYNFYQLLRLNGYDVVKARYNRRSFDINVKTLIDAGLVKSDLQNLGNIDDDKHDIASLINIDFDNQVPFGFVTPISSHIDSFNVDMKGAFLPMTSMPIEYDVDSGVLDINDLNNELMELTRIDREEYLDNYDYSFNDYQSDSSHYENQDDGAVMNCGQLKKLISK